MKQPDLFPATARLTMPVRAMALSDPAWQSVEVKTELVFPVGEPPPNDDRRWRFTAEDLAAVAADFASRTEPAPALYRHGDDPARGGMAAGWIDSVEVREDGLYAQIRYTERALSEIRDGAWGYRSPGFDAEQDEEGFWHPRRLSEVSLVNDPAIGGMPPIQAAVEPVAEPQVNAAADEAAPDSPTAPEAVPVKGGPKMDPLKALAAVRKALGLEDTAGPNEIMSAFGKLMAGQPAEAPEEDAPEPEMPEAEKAPDLPVEVPAAASVKPRIELVPDENETKAAREARERIKSLVASAVADGKVTSATLESAVRFASADPDGFADWTAAAPVLAPSAGQVVTASAADRAPQSNAERLTALFRNQAASRPHFTQRGN